MTKFFGASAERLAGRLPDGLHAIVADETAMASAYREAVSRRERGERFYLLLLFNDRRVGICNNYVNALNVQYTDPDDRFVLAEQLAQGTLQINGQSITGLWSGPNPYAHAMKELASLSDELLVRSFAEYDRLLAAGCFPRQFRRILLEPAAPPIEPRAAGDRCVAVWAGTRPAADLTIALIGLEQHRGTVVYIASEPLPNVRATFVPIESSEAVAALERSSCIVCVDPGDPSDAVAFARRGKSVVAPITSGAHEFVAGIVAWDSASAPALTSCVATSQGREVVGGSPDELPLAPRAPALAVPAEEVPLVTIITPTYNRREYLQSMLESIAAQSYPRIESVIVNDGGEPVDDIVAKFPFARCITAETNAGALNACKIGLDAARGDYIGLLPDDDWLFPDHVERIMAAILRSGAAWGHSLSLLRFLKRDAAGQLETYGFNASIYAQTVTPMRAQVGTPIAGHQCLQRRDTFDLADVGWYLNVVGTDQEYHMRLLERYSPVMIDQHTCEFRDHPTNTGRTFNWAEAMREVYEEIRPLPDRPHVTELRRQALEQLRNVPPGQNVHKPSITF